jgi:hypothetical protein
LIFFKKRSFSKPFVFFHYILASYKERDQWFTEWARILLIFGSLHWEKLSWNGKSFLLGGRGEKIFFDGVFLFYFILFFMIFFKKIFYRIHGGRYWVELALGFFNDGWRYPFTSEKARVPILGKRPLIVDIRHRRSHNSYYGWKIRKIW